MAKKSSSKIVSAVKAIKATRAKRPTSKPVRDRPVRDNPGRAGGDLMHTLTPILPAAASYIGARLIGRILRMIIGARIAGGKFEKHFGPLGNLAAFGGAYYAGKKVASARKYQNEMLIGAGIALIQSLIETYLPGMAHFVDAGSPQAALPQPGFGKKGLAGTVSKRNNVTRYVSPGELESERAALNERVARSQSQNIESEAQEVEDELPESMAGEDEAVALAEENEELSGLYDGVFSN